MAAPFRNQLGGRISGLEPRPLPLVHPDGTAAGPPGSSATDSVLRPASSCMGAAGTGCGSLRPDGIYSTAAGSALPSACRTSQLSRDPVECRHTGDDHPGEAASGVASSSCTSNRRHQSTRESTGDGQPCPVHLSCCAMLCLPFVSQPGTSSRRSQQLRLMLHGSRGSAVAQATAVVRQQVVGPLSPAAGCNAQGNSYPASGAMRQPGAGRKPCAGFD